MLTQGVVQVSKAHAVLGPQRQTLSNTVYAQIRARRQELGVEAGGGLIEHFHLPLHELVAAPLELAR